MGGVRLGDVGRQGRLSCAGGGLGRFGSWMGWCSGGGGWFYFGGFGWLRLGWFIFDLGFCLLFWLFLGVGV
jgi:hypothetical protein